MVNKIILNSVTGKSGHFYTKMDPSELQRYTPPANVAGILRFVFYGSMKFVYNRSSNGHKTFADV